MSPFSTFRDRSPLEDRLELPGVPLSTGSPWPAARGFLWAGSGSPLGRPLKLGTPPWGSLVSPNGSSGSMDRLKRFCPRRACSCGRRPPATSRNEAGLPVGWDTDIGEAKTAPVSARGALAPGANLGGSEPGLRAPESLMSGRSLDMGISLSSYFLLDVLVDAVQRG